jgi:hypothetical protein
MFHPLAAMPKPICTLYFVPCLRRGTAEIQNTKHKDQFLLIRVLQFNKRERRTLWVG